MVVSHPNRFQVPYGLHAWRCSSSFCSFASASATVAANGANMGHDSAQYSQQDPCTFKSLLRFQRQARLKPTVSASPPCIALTGHLAMAYMVNRETIPCERALHL